MGRASEVTEADVARDRANMVAWVARQHEVAQQAARRGGYEIQRPVDEELDVERYPTRK